MPKLILSNILLVDFKHVTKTIFCPQIQKVGEKQYSHILRYLYMSKLTKLTDQVVYQFPPSQVHLL